MRERMLRPCYLLRLLGFYSYIAYMAVRSPLSEFSCLRQGGSWILAKTHPKSVSASSNKVPSGIGRPDAQYEPLYRAIP